MLVSYAISQSLQGKKNNDDCKKKDEQIASDAIGGTIAIVVGICAAIVAYRCNTRSKKHSPIGMAILAFLFSDIYLAQAALRFTNGEYKCGGDGFRHRM